jgi:hypothetical protein
MRTPKHFVNLTGKTKSFKMLEFPLNQPQMYYRYLCDLCPLAAFIFYDLNYKMVIFLSQTESTPKLLFRKKSLVSLSVGLCVSLYIMLRTACHRTSQKKT